MAWKSLELLIASKQKYQTRKYPANSVQRHVCAAFEKDRGAGGAFLCEVDAAAPATAAAQNTAHIRLQNKNYVCIKVFKWFLFSM